MKYLQYSLSDFVIVFKAMIKVDADVGSERETKTKWPTKEKLGNDCKVKARKYFDLKLTGS